MIFDSLTHFTEDGQWFDTEFDCSLKAFESFYKASKLNGAIVSGLCDGINNSYVIDTCRESSKNIHALPMLSREELNLMDETLNYYIRNEVIGIKIHPRFSNINLQDKILQDFINLTSQKNIVIFICTVFDSKISTRENQIGQLLQLINNNPGGRFVLLHGGYTSLLTVAEQIRNHENVLLDLSFTLCRFFDSSIGLDIKYLFRNFSKRICIGTDFPEFDYRSVKKSLSYLNIEFSNAVDNGVLGGNLLKFLELN